VVLVPGSVVVVGSVAVVVDDDEVSGIVVVATTVDEVGARVGAVVSEASSGDEGLHAAARRTTARIANDTPARCLFLGLPGDDVACVVRDLMRR
jgi:hypothetical protein